MSDGATDLATGLRRLRAKDDPVVVHPGLVLAVEGAVVVAVAVVEDMLEGSVLEHVHVPKLDRHPECLSFGHVFEIRRVHPCRR